VFAERQASVVADQLIAQIRNAGAPPGYDGTGSCYIEFGGDQVARVDVDFYSTPGQPTGTFVAPSEETAAEKAAFASNRRTRNTADAHRPVSKRDKHPRVRTESASGVPRALFRIASVFLRSDCRILRNFRTH